MGQLWVQYSDLDLTLDLLECKIQELIAEISAYNDVQRTVDIPEEYESITEDQDSSNCEISYNRDTENHPAPCQFAYNTTDTETDSDNDECEKSSTFDSTLKRFHETEKELRRKEIELKEKELQDRIAGIKLKLAKDDLSKNISIVIQKKSADSLKSTAKSKKKRGRKIVSKDLTRDESKRSLADILGCSSSILDFLRCTNKNTSNYCENTLKADYCACPKKVIRSNKKISKKSPRKNKICKKASIECNCSKKVSTSDIICGGPCKCSRKSSKLYNTFSNSCTRLLRKISLKSESCSTCSSLGPASPCCSKKKQPENKTKKSCFKNLMFKMYGIEL